MFWDAWCRYRPWRPDHLRLLGRHILPSRNGVPQDDRVHLKAVLDWVRRAQDVRRGLPDQGGMSAGWSFEDGWLPSYPETSGYLVETLLVAAGVLNDTDLVCRAGEILDWELSLQQQDGAFPGHFGEAGSRPVIFNTGQIVHGLLAGYGHLERTDCLEAAVRACRWMVASQDGDGCWRRNVHNGVPHTYNTRAAWALARTGCVTGEKDLVRAAEKNLDWALGQQNSEGWFHANAFVPGRPPFTHTIAYAVRGLQESGLLLGRDRYVAAALRTSTVLVSLQKKDGSLAGAYDPQWRPRGRYVCLTGLAQIAIIWKRWVQTGLDHDGRFAQAFHRALGYLKRRHRLTGSGGPEDGAVAGSYPLWGAYSRFEFPNWAAKFFADVLLMKMADRAIPSDPQATQGGSPCPVFAS
ncbi:prenyltransferase/squalene oxidase repeat-containing protein [Desulfacinum hydrothermale]|nr:prenyltransferase/squalene oxidase repeat-containing protein [Desulfacinum hydrothermale]